MKIEKSCGVIVFHGTPKKFLLLHHGKAHWDFPKGHVEGKETEIETLRRELKEETGIETIKLVPGYRKKIRYFFTSLGETIAKTVFFYLAETFDEKVKLSHEHSGYEWLEFEDALEKLSFENTRKLLREAKEVLNQKHK